MTEPVFVINSRITKEDYKSFIYFTVFVKNKGVIMSAGLSLVVALLLGYMRGGASVLRCILYFALLFSSALLTLLFKANAVVKQRCTTGSTGFFEENCLYRFYDSEVSGELSSIKGGSSLKYSRFYTRSENRSFIMLYINARQAYLIKKRDIADIDSFRAFIKGKIT